MRFFTLAVLCLSLLLAAPLGASAKSKQDKGPEIIAKLLAKVIEAAGNRVSTETGIEDSEVMGDGNEIVQIEELTLTINIGDVVINSNESQGGGGNEIAFRLLDLMGMAHEQMGMGGGGGHGGPDMPMHPDVPMMGGSRGIGMGNMHGKDMPMGHPDMGQKKGGHGEGLPKMDMRMDNPHGNVPMMGGSHGIGNMHGKDLPMGHPGMGQMKGGQGKGHPKMDGRGKDHPKMDGHGDMQRDMPHGDNPGFHPEVMEMIHKIPQDVDPEFFGLMMRIAEMAWERPELRERLEQMLQRAGQGETDLRPHGR